MALVPFWQLVHEYRTIDAHAAIGAKIGALVCVLGFALWWFFIQRHEDVLLRCERISAVIALRSRTDGSSTISDRPDPRIEARPVGSGAGSRQTPG
jgi:hypothetical protein